MSKPQYSNLVFGLGANIQGLPGATAPGMPVTYEQMTALIEGNAWKDDVRVAAPANVNLSSPGASIDGVSMNAGDRFLAPNQTDQTQGGWYVWNGAAVAATRAVDGNAGSELNAAYIPVAEGTSAGVVYRQTQVNITLGTSNVLFVAAFTSSPPASTTTAGLAAFATQAEVDAGSVTNKTLTPQTLNNYAGKKKRLEGTVGDASATQYSITHSFNTRGVSVEVYRNSTPWETIGCDVERPDVNTVVLRFASAPSNAQFAYVILA